MGSNLIGNHCNTGHCVPIPKPGCLFRLAGECVYYSGPAIAGTDIASGDTFNTVTNKLVTYINTHSGGGGGGGVSSVGITVPTGFTVTGSPITTSGVIAISSNLSGLISGNGNGFITTQITSPLTYIGSALGMLQASSFQNGYLSAGDYSTFSGKISNITGLISQGSNVLITGSGTPGSPYVISATTGGGSGGVTGFSFSNANGITGNVSNPTTSPSLTLSIDNGSITNAKLANGIDATKINSGAVTNTVFGYLANVTSDIQTQINAKQATLVSGSNIKTINSTSILGAGNIAVLTGTGTANNIPMWNGGGTGFSPSGIDQITVDTTRITGYLNINTGSNPIAQTITATHNGYTSMRIENTSVGSAASSALELRVGSTAQLQMFTTSTGHSVIRSGNGSLKLVTQGPTPVIMFGTETADNIGEYGRFTGNGNLQVGQPTEQNFKIYSGGTIGAISDIEITDFTRGVILKSPNGSRFRVTVGNDGALTTTAI